MADPKTVEVMLNPNGKLWVERLGEDMQCVGTLDPKMAEAIIREIAGYHERETKREKPLLECEFPLDGSRFTAQLPPVVKAPTFTIRKRAVAIFTLGQYVEKGIMTPRQHDALMEAIKNHRNILVIGGTGSGKTTLINAIIGAMVVYKPEERVVIIEDTEEIQCKAENVVPYKTMPFAEHPVTMTDLLKTTLRMRPDRILVGEVRGPEALDLLMAWNTGHEGGAATLHANNALEGLDRLAMLISMNPNAPRQIEPLIAKAVHVAVHITRAPEGRIIREIIEVRGYEDGHYIFNNL